MAATRIVALQAKLEQHRKAILLLTKGRMGISIDADCPNCGHPEMSGLLTPNAGLLGVRTCRQCGHSDLI